MRTHTGLQHKKLLGWVLALVALLSALTVWLRKRCIKRNRMGVKSEQEIQKAKEGSLNTLNALYKQIADTAEGVV